MACPRRRGGGGGRLGCDSRSIGSEDPHRDAGIDRRAGAIASKAQTLNTGQCACRTCHQARPALEELRPCHRWRSRRQRARAISGAKFSYGNVTRSFFTRGDSYWVRTNARLKARRFRIKYTFATAAAAILDRTSGGRLPALSITWDARPNDRADRCFHQYPGQNIKAVDTLHWTGAIKLNFHGPRATRKSVRTTTADTHVRQRIPRSTSDSRVSRPGIGAHRGIRRNRSRGTHSHKVLHHESEGSAGPGSSTMRPIARYTGGAPTSRDECVWSCHSRRGQIENRWPAPC